MDAGRDALALLDGALQDRGVHVHVGHLAAGARAAVGDVDLDGLRQAPRSGMPLRGSPGVATIGRIFGEIDLETSRRTSRPGRS